MAKNKSAQPQTLIDRASRQQYLARAGEDPVAEDFFRELRKLLGGYSSETAEACLILLLGRKFCTGCNCRKESH